MSGTESDAQKVKSNFTKNSIFLAHTANMTVPEIFIDERFNHGAPRNRAFGIIEGQAHCMVFADGSNTMLIINLSHAHAKQIVLHIGT